MYDIQNKSDLQSGASLVVRIPEEELDSKALYTILADKPDFLLPFRHRYIDGQIEFIYHIGNRSKLAYLSGERSPGEYADLWFGALQPLLDCNDWFMTPYSFVLQPEYLYGDKNSSKSISFVYIPSVKACADDHTLKTMVLWIAKQNHVTDMQLENKVVWAIQDFHLAEFLQMLKLYQTDSRKTVSSSETIPSQAIKEIPRQTMATPEIQQPVLEGRSSAASLVSASSFEPQVPAKPFASPISSNIPETSGYVSGEQRSNDIHINFLADNKEPQSVKLKGGLFGSKKEKEPKPPKEPKVKKEPKPKGSLFGKKKEMQQEIVQGAAAAMPASAGFAEHVMTPSAIPDPAPVYHMPMEVQDSVTEIEGAGAPGVAKLRYVGNGNHPRIIEVDVEEGKVFTIGRFDISVGNRQSSFEFDPKTRAVSRRHAAIERREQEYYLVDLSSSAGTFIDGKKLPPNVPMKLENGCRASFGHAGADYIWEL